MSVDTVNNSLKSLGAVFDETSVPTKEEDPLGRDAFLKMLVAQMEHQDPLNPMEGTDFTAQLAQFSQLEQLFNVNDTLESLSESMNANGKENVLDYIGKEITSEDSTLSVKDGQISSGLFTLDEASDVVISIYDDLNQEIMTLYPGELDAGTHQVDWNGYDWNGTPVADGTYHFQVAAISESGAYVPVKTKATGIVTGVTYDMGRPYLVVDDRWVDPNYVVSVQDPANTGEAEIGESDTGDAEAGGEGTGDAEASGEGTGDTETSADGTGDTEASDAGTGDTGAGGDGTGDTDSSSAGA